MKRTDKITELENELNFQTKKYLEESGWSYTCRTPDCCWLWSREFDGKTILVPESHAVSMQQYLDAVASEGEEE